MLVDELTGQGLLDKGIITWNKFPNHEWNSLYEFKHYDDNVRLLSDDFETKLDSFLIPEEYHQSFLHVIGEATTTVPFITEKTCLPILFKKPFIIMADQYFHKKLVDLGFELYDEIIDYSFDSEPDMLKRAEAIALNVKRISEQNTQELYNRIKDKAERNYNNYLRIVGNMSYVPQVIIDRVNMLVNDTSLKYNATDGRYVKMLQEMYSILDSTIWSTENFQDLFDPPENIKKIIFDGVLEFDSDRIHGSKEKFRELVEIARKKQISLYLTTASHPSDTHINTDGITLSHWPTFWLSMAFNRLSYSPNYPSNNGICLDIENMTVGEKTPLKYPYISMNKAPKHHRALMMDMLAKHDMIDKGVVIWREWRESYDFQYWDQKIMLRDQKEGFKYQEILPLEYALSFIQLVPETDENIFTLSEKTAMPLFFNKPFLVAGSMHFHKKLVELGFKLYDELFDYSFDDEPDMSVRYDLIATNINRYVNSTPKQLKELHKSVFDKCVYNKRMAMHIATNTDFMPVIWKDLISHHIKNNKQSYQTGLEHFMRSRKNEYRL
jgi:hypothetical protein